jgi:nitroreductase
MLNIIKKRRSIRKYQTKDVEQEKINEVLKAAMFAPSAMHRRPWEFIVVKDKSIKEKLSKATPYSSFANEAPVVLVLCANQASSDRWVEDLSIVAAHIYLETTNQGLGTCFIQIKDSQPPNGKNGEEYVKKILSLPKNIRVLCLMPLGYPAERIGDHQDSEFEESKIHSNKW